MSHGQSQMVKVATPLHKAMEYETCPQMEELLKEDHQHPGNLFMTVTLESTNITGLPQSSNGLLKETPVKSLE